MTNIKLKKALLIAGAALPLVIFGIVYAIFRFYPQAEIYTLTEDSSQVGVHTNVSQDKKMPQAMYESLHEIDLNDSQEYIIKTIDSSIVICDTENNVLYNVNALLSDFPQNDIDILANGLSVLGKELYEIVSYLES